MQRLPLPDVEKVGEIGIADVVQQPVDRRYLFHYPALFNLKVCSVPGELRQRVCDNGNLLKGLTYPVHIAEPVPRQVELAMGLLLGSPTSPRDSLSCDLLDLFTAGVPDRNAQPANARYTSPPSA